MAVNEDTEEMENGETRQKQGTSTPNVIEIFSPKIIETSENPFLFERIVAELDFSTCTWVWKIALGLYSLVMYIIDFVADINTAVNFYSDGKVVEFRWTLAFILLPAFINTVLYTRKYIQDSKQKKRRTKWQQLQRIIWIFFLLLQVAPLLLLIQTLICIIKWRTAYSKNDTDKKLDNLVEKMENDKVAVLIKIVECFLEAAPQLVLQISLVLWQTENIRVFQKVTICTSVLSLLPAMCVYSMEFLSSLGNMQHFWRRTVLLTLGHYFVTLGRAISIAMIACLYPKCTIAACCIHIGIFVFYLLLSEHNIFRKKNMFIQIAYCSLFGVVYLFTYILPIDTYAISRTAVYYTLCLVQNICCIVIWYVYPIKSNLENLVPGLSIASFCVGVCLMMVYYMYVHPKGRNMQEYPKFLLDNKMEPIILTGRETEPVMVGKVKVMGIKGTQLIYRRRGSSSSNSSLP